MSDIKDRSLKILDNLIFLFFCALVFFLPISNSGIEISFGCIFAGMVIRFFLKPPSFSWVRDFFSDRVNLAVLVFYLLIGISIFASGDLPGKSFRAWIAKWGEGVLLFYFVRAFLRKEQIKTLLYVFLAATFVVCVDGIYQKFTGLDFIRGFEIKEVNNTIPIRATFSYHTDYASFLVTAFFVNLGVLAFLKKRRMRVILGILALLVAVNMFYTYSRGSWLAFLLVSFFLAVFIPSRKAKAGVLLIMAIFLAGIFVTPALRERFAFMLQKGGDSGRFRIWGGALEVFRRSPVVGCGLGLFMDRFREYTDMGAQYAHNCYLQMLAETGLVGFLSFSWVIVSIIRKSCVTLLKKTDMLSMGLFSGFLAFLVVAFFDTQLYSVKLSILFWLIAAILVKSLNNGGFVPEAGTREGGM